MGLALKPLVGRNIADPLTNASECIIQTYNFSKAMKCT